MRNSRADGGDDIDQRLSDAVHVQAIHWIPPAYFVRDAISDPIESWRAPAYTTAAPPPCRYRNFCLLLHNGKYK